MPVLRLAVLVGAALLANPPSATAQSAEEAAAGAARRSLLPTESATSSTTTPAGDDAAESLSCGAANRGALASARPLPDAGFGYVTPEPWRARGLRYGTDELVGLIERAAARVAREHGGAMLAVADLSAAQGGPVPRHASHQSGRDADLIYYAIDRAGDPFQPDHHMPMYAPDGRAQRADSPVPAPRIEERFFDLRRNWSLAVALVSDPEVQVTRIFVSTRVRDWLLAYGRAAGAPLDVFERVQAALYTARDSGSHQDHLHVRIACSAEDVEAGRCTDAPASPPRMRRRRGKRRHRPPPARWYARVQCIDPRAVATADAPDATPSRNGLVVSSEPTSDRPAKRKAGKAHRSARTRGSLRPKRRQDRRSRR
jgi:penicillin-insensitive murein endopeptidase